MITVINTVSAQTTTVWVNMIAAALITAADVDGGDDCGDDNIGGCGDK